MIHSRRRNRAAFAANDAGLRLTWTAKPLDQGFSAPPQHRIGAHLGQQTPRRITRNRPTRSNTVTGTQPYALSDQRPSKTIQAILDSSDAGKEWSALPACRGSRKQPDMLAINA
jgi:hypothetical protein